LCIGPIEDTSANAPIPRKHCILHYIPPDSNMTISICIVDARGAEHAISARAGQSILDAVGQAGIEGLVAECGGCCSCATCHCYVEADPQSCLAPPDEAETTMLDFVAATRQPGSRLACQLVPGPTSHAGLRIRLPDRQF